MNGLESRKTRKGFGGSNPSPPASDLRIYVAGVVFLGNASPFCPVSVLRQLYSSLWNLPASRVLGSARW